MTDTPGQFRAFAEWSPPGSAFPVRYLPDVFREIEFLVKDGSRRIAHGGIELGGLLFGRMVSEGARQWVQIEAFRSIDCEHAYGPSFVLSERDLAAMREQLARDGSDPDLHGMQLLGWFIGHSRNPLSLTSHEAELFDKLFPRPGQVTLLVKPERFNPSHFALLVRGADRSVERDATLPDRSFELPPVKASADEKAGETRAEPERADAPLASPFTFGEGPGKPQEGLAPVGTKEPAVPPSRETWEPPHVLSVTEAPPVPSTREQRLERSFDYSLEAAGGSLLPSGDEIRRRRIERTRRASGMDRDEAVVQAPLPEEYPEERRRISLNGMPMLVLVLLLGCVAGYWIYLQFFAPPISLEVEQQGARLAVMWAPEQTAGREQATIQVGETPSRLLTAEEKEAGRAEVAGYGSDIRVELVVHHWMHDSKGVVRYVRAGLPSIP